MGKSDRKVRLDEIDAALVRLYAERRPITRAIRMGALRSDELSAIDRQIDELEIEEDRLLGGIATSGETKL